MSRYSIETYNKKRDFERTREPPGEAGPRSNKHLRFVIQKHDARRLHYDFRLEMDGVLKSWAVPKGPSADPGDKRLAVRTEDHPLSYAGFEGIIPKNQYGAGSVMVWDAGEWQPDTADPVKSLQKGKLEFRLRGRKLKGAWHLVRMRGRQGEKVENWLLIKGSDGEAGKTQPDFLEQTDYSVKSGKPFTDIAAGDIESIDVLTRKYRTVQLATLVDKPPVSSAWLHEVKYDGYRIMVFVNGSDVVIRTRNGHNWTDKFPAIAEALSQAGAGTFVLDGEAVVLDERGISSFQALQNNLGSKNAPIMAYFFDLLYLNGRDHAALPLKQRQQDLGRLLQDIPGKGVIFQSETIDGRGDKVVKQACELGLEGIISKKADAAYQPGRGKTWVKSKCIKRQEFIITGFIPASDNPKAVGALHLGYHRDGKLTYAGKVGTGFDRREAAKLYGALKEMATPSSPFSATPKNPGKGTVWVEPALLCEVRFAEITGTGKVRHASYQGLRMDKPPEEVVEEKPRSMKATTGNKKNARLDVAGVGISNPDRVIFPEAGLTKGELAEFYAEFSEVILPELHNRPISVVRCPGGISKDCFYQRGKGKGMPAHIHEVTLKHGGKSHDYMLIRSAAGLLELVQMGGIEIHPWGATADNIEKPDRIIFDLDPDTGIPFEAVKLAARDVQRNLDSLGLEAFLKVTGGKGLHVVIPVQRRHDWEQIKEFAGNFARHMVKRTPEAYVSTMSKKKRGGKIFIDYFRNDYASTAVMNYCVRSRPGAPVAVPLYWDELETLESADQFHIDDVRRRMKESRELLKEYQSCRQSLTKKVIQAVK